MAWFVLAFFAASPRIAGGAPRIRRPSGRITISDAPASWLFTVPVLVRYQLAFDAEPTRAVLHVFLRTVFGPRDVAAELSTCGKRSAALEDCHPTG